MALKNPVRLGDTHHCPKSGSTAHGQGKVVSGQSSALFDGMPVACAGDMVQCADGSMTQILEGNACVKVNGKRVALVGDLTEHGGTLLTGASDIWIEEGDAFVELNGKIAVNSGTYFVCDSKQKETASSALTPSCELWL